MSVNTEAENEKRIRLSEKIVKLSIEIAKLEGRTIPHMQLGEDGVFYVVKEHKLESKY